MPTSFILQVRSGRDMILDDGTNSVLRSIWLPFIVVVVDTVAIYTNTHSVGATRKGCLRFEEPVAYLPLKQICEQFVDH